MEYSACRTLSHAWMAEYTLHKRGNIYELQLSCDRCDTVRHDLINVKSGEVLARKYDYPKDYVTKGQGRVPRTLSRQAFMADFTGGHTLGRLKAVK